ncbi:asparagine synthase (glutamine-hydrolyzing) [uncultured Tyzzerella sp.]|uniref:asparagine synthase (glutamine-hydrolyzing) n=1 Tax=uncultured Tyzzerella sp. TaxID=2321398 RepID=UPI0029423EF7|nr:asparagine synthase (glutamine-hydrolyzing) [uncultured Tyzzerella sp.]
MCGIAGFSSFNEHFLNNEGFFTEILENMRESLKRRGNDAKGFYIDNHFCATHARLSIRDLTESGTQPIIKIINNNKYIIVYNGEIYNTSELKKDLKTKGYKFTTSTDTEVILYLFIEYKEKCVEYLNGIFAFSIYDTQNETMYLFRDRVGIKPLFYTINDNTLVFGSEPKAIFKYPSIVPTINLDSLKQILGLGPARIAGKGVFKNLYEIKPGHFAIFNKYGFKEIQYWELKSDYHKDSYEQTVEKVSFLVRDSIESQLVSDVDVCTFLSGGIDSSIVTAVSSNYLNKLGKKLNTFSFDFKENDIYFKSNSFQPERDKPYVDIMLKEYDLNHKYLECNEEELIDLLYKAVDAKDLPGMADVDASMLYFCSLVSKENKVALTGECADEIFGGYPWFYREDLLNSNTFPWSKNIDTRELFLIEDLKDKLKLSEFSLENYEKSIKSTPYLYGESKEECKRREIAYLNIKWFMSTLLERMDRMSMYNSLEARVPFADHRIIEYLWNVPWDMKYKNNIEKSLLREATKDLLPKELLNRKKSPYPKTYNPNYEKLLINELQSIINNNNSPINNLIDKNKVLEFIKKPSDYGKPWFGQLMSSPQLMAYFIQINYWLDKYNLSL